MKQISKHFVPAPFQVSLKSPPDYLQAITNVNPSWGKILANVKRISSLEACALWAAAVTVANACRISETLRITIGQLLPNGQAWATGSKGSSSRLLYLGISPGFLAQLQALPKNLNVFPVPYISVWRACVKHGLADRLPGHKHLAVTHAGRYRLAQQISAQASSATAGEVLGHKNENSIQYYVHPSGCKVIVSKKKALSKEQKLYNLLDLLIQKQSTTKGKQNE